MAAAKWGLVVFSDPSDDDSRDIVTIQPGVPLRPTAAPDASVLLTPKPIAYDLRLSPACCEVMHLVSRSVTLTTTDSTAWTVGPAEAIVVPAGAAKGWTSPKAVQMTVCIAG